MKFKHINPNIKDTLGVGVTRPGDVFEEERPEIIRELLINPVFQVIVEEEAKQIKPKPKKAEKKEEESD